MSEQDLTPDQLEQLREQLASVPAGEVVAEAAVPLITMAQMRLGLPPEHNARFRDLDAARLLVDALGGLLAATEGRLGAPEPSLRNALANLRLAFAEVAAHPDHPAGEASAPPPPPEPEDSGIPRPPSGLWVPGQD
jgi:Domain of unknown function (DUF1844)